METNYIRKKLRRKVDHLTYHCDNGVEWFSFPILDQFDFIVNGYSTRVGGVSVGDVGSLNLSLAREVAMHMEVPEEARNGGYEIGVRPNDIVFDPESSLRARVDSRVFLGSEYNYFLSLGQKQIRVQQSMLDARTKGVAEEGETVGIRFLNIRCYPLKEGGATA